MGCGCWELDQITDSRSNLAPSTKGCSEFSVLGLVGGCGMLDAEYLAVAGYWWLVTVHGLWGVLRVYCWILVARCWDAGTMDLGN